MATAREHFALDWIKADLLETLNDARIALDDYAEQGREETRMRACLTGLHQVHGTLVMLDLKGVTQLADHLEQLAQAMLAKRITDESAAGQALMQGILELPGYLDELQQGAEDSVSTSMALVNEIRQLLDLELLQDPAGASLREGASDEVVARFNAIGGPEKVARIRSAYQNVLLSILKGEDRSAAVNTLSKIAVGLEKVTEGAPLARQWQAFGEFVTALKQHTGVLESEAVKLLRRVDLEIKTLAKDGEATLRQPVNMELVGQLLDGAIARENNSAAVTGLQEAVARDVSNNTLAISGRQAMGSAAEALQEDLSVVKDKLDLLVRADSVDLEALRQLVTPLKQIGSTLSLLGFESSREIVSDQIDAIESIVVLGDADPQGVASIAGALVQIDENLSSVVLGSGQTEIEQITNDAQLQVLREARKDLDMIKQAIVDFVTAHWSLGHLEPVPNKITDIVGALEIIPLTRAIEMLKRVRGYISDRLLHGHRPEWQELDQFADVISAVDYYLERLADETSSGADDVLLVAERSLTELENLAPEVAELGADVAPALEDEIGEVKQVEDVQVAVDIDEPEQALPDEVAAEISASSLDATVIDDVQIADTEEISAVEMDLEAEAEAEAEAEDLNAVQVNQADIGQPISAEDEEIDATAIEADAQTEPSLQLETDAGFDLGSDIFAEIDGSIDLGTEESAEESIAGTEEPVEAAEEPVASVEIEQQSQPSPSEVESPDPEIVEIFVEEVDEVLETIAEFLPQWADGFDNADALTEVRRAFHTLKGSGRIVQAVAIGELAWGVENMLNRVMDGTVTPNSQFVSTIDAARALVPSLRDAFAQGEQGDLDQIGQLIEQADVLASGGAIEATEPEFTEAVEDEQVSSAQDETISAADDLAESIAADVDDAAWSVQSSETSIEPEQPSETLEPDSTPTTQELFIAEAFEQLDLLHAQNAQAPWQLSDVTARVFHTLVGASALAELDQFHLIVSSAHQVVEAFRHAPANEALQNFFVAAENHIRECLTALQADQAWEEPLEFVAEADDLLALQGASPRAMDQLLDAPAVAGLFEAEDEFLAYLAAADRGEPCASTEGVQTGLAELATLALEVRAQPLSDLALALKSKLIAAGQQTQLPAGTATVLRAAFNQVLDQLNELAVGSELASQDELIAALNNMDLSAAKAPEEAQQESVEQSPVTDDAVSDIVPEDIEAELGEAEVSEPIAAQADSEDAVGEGVDQEVIDLAEIDADLVQVFFEEAEEISEELEAGIMSWSEERDNRVYMENMLRGLHTLKGGARLCGLTTLGDMAHDFESAVIEVQVNERSIDDALFVELNRRFDDITNRVAEITEQVNSGEQPGTEPVVSHEAEAPVDLEVVTSEAADITPEDEPDTTTVDSQREPVQLSDVNKIVEAVTKPVAAEPAQSTSELPASIVADDASSKPAAVERNNQEMVRVSSGLLEELVNLAGESSILRARVEQGMSDFTVSLDEMEITIERLREQLRRLEIETETQILYRHERSDGPQYENFDPLEMDRYNQLQQLSRGLSESASDMLDLKETLLFKARESETLLLQQARINTEIQEGLMRTRMVPFSRLLPRLRRIVRQVSGELQKDVEFHVQNGEGELDRNLLERMVPPLEHMLRNAVDHGIESSEMRRNFGKSATGRIDLRLTREGGDVVIEISDDGGGIDVESVRAKAIERGLMAADADLGDEEVLQFVLAAGFSTAKSVTQISGRGVGLDVVTSEVKQLGGSVNIVSRAGKGTRFVLRVPFTVSVNRALMVSVNEDLYAIPLNTIEGIVLLSQDQLQALYSSDSKTFEYAGIPYRVRYLGQYLGREYHGPGGGQSSVPVVLVRSGDHAMAIHVDQVQGSREIVVKSLGPQFAGVGGISGATILGDGSVVVILDLLALIRAQQFEKAQHQSTTQKARSGPRCVMVVDDSVTVRKVTSRLLERQGMDVLVAKDGVEAVALLQERKPDVMLLDIEMPRMDGFEVARQVRHDDRLIDLPIVMISSRTGDKHKEHANQLGVNKFLGKPFQENELLATIDELVTRR